MTYPLLDEAKNFIASQQPGPSTITVQINTNTNSLSLHRNWHDIVKKTSIILGADLSETINEVITVNYPKPGTEASINQKETLKSLLSWKVSRALQKRGFLKDVENIEYWFNHNSSTEVFFSETKNQWIAEILLNMAKLAMSGNANDLATAKIIETAFINKLTKCFPRASIFRQKQKRRKK